MSSSQIISHLHTLKNRTQSVNYARFFKTGIGEYGEGDQFRGISVPQIRATAKKYIDTEFSEISILLAHPIHEVRMTAVIILVYKYPNSNKHKLLNFYLEHISAINNRDFVDVSADKICGQFLIDFAGQKEAGNVEKLLRKFLISDNLRHRRIAMISTFQLIKNNSFALAIEFATQLLGDTHDLIHKAVGRMLREIRKKDNTLIESFIITHNNKIPRTALRYAIEKFPEPKRKDYLQKKI